MRALPPRTRSTMDKLRFLLGRVGSELGGGDMGLHEETRVGWGIVMGRNGVNGWRS